MWSDPIDNALAQIQTLLEQLTGNGYKPTADQIERAAEATQRARDVRAKEKEADRLVTPQDRW